jgi:hypothetical protein
VRSRLGKDLTAYGLVALATRISEDGVIDTFSVKHPLRQELRSSHVPK